MTAWLCLLVVSLFKQVIFVYNCWFLHIYYWLSDPGKIPFSILELKGIISVQVIIDSILLLQLVTAFGFPYDNSIASGYRSLWSLFPPNLLAKALNLLAEATSTPQDVGISWSKRGECAPNDDECVITIVRKQTDSQTHFTGYSSFDNSSF